MTSHDHDLPFLQELAGRLDEEQEADVSGRDLAQATGVDPKTAEQVLARLRQQGLIERRDAPTRYGDGPLDFPLELTQDGWDTAARGRL